MSGPVRQADADEMWETARWGGDLDWWEITGACGGCGEEKCHDGQPCKGEWCDLCPDRNPSARPALPVERADEEGQT